MKRFSILILLTVCFVQSFFAQCKIENCGLIVSGRVTDLQIDHSKKGYVVFDVQLAMEFKNESSQPIILFKPNTNNSYFGDGYYLGGKSLSLTENEKHFFAYGAWESVMGSPFYRDLASKLDTKTPSGDYTKILQPNEIWSFADKTEIVFNEKKEKYPSSVFDKSWEEMKELPSKLWLTVDYELNPWNVEFFKPKLLRKLKKRWKGFGNVPIDENEDGSFSHFGISSEPMMIDFSEAKEIKSK